MIRCSMTRLLCVRLGAGPTNATLVNLHILRRVALSQANIWSRRELANPRTLAQSCAMRRLFLVRHAKAELSVGRDDYARKLTERGRVDARRVAKTLAARRFLPDILTHSGAARAKETAEILAAEWRSKVALEEDARLYDASLTTLLD